MLSPEMRNSFACKLGVLSREREKKKKKEKKREGDSIGIARRAATNEAYPSINQTLEIRITISKSRDIRNMATYTSLYVQQ